MNSIEAIFDNRRYLTVSFAGKWAKVYQGTRTPYTEVLLNFPPSAYPDFIRHIERRKGNIARIHNYDDGVGFIALKTPYPYQIIASALLAIAGQSPQPITHRGTLL